MIASPQRKPLLLLALLLGVALPIFLQLGERGLNEPDEGRYAEMGREMVVTGDWMVPRLNGVPHYAKPPWIYWCVGLSLKLFGMNEWAARLPSALAALVTVLLAFDLARRMAGTRAGLYSAFALTSSLLFFVGARLVSPDMMQTACITAAIYCFWRWWDPHPRATPWLAGFFVAIAIGFLDKGPVSLAVCFLTVLGFLLLEWKLSEMKRVRFWAGLLLGLLLVAAIALPWFLALCQRNPDLYEFYLVGEVKDRILHGRGRTQPFYYHCAWLPGDCWPWTILTGCAVACHWMWRGFGDERGRRASNLLLAWFALPFLLFCFASSKLPTYLLPVTVPLSLMLGIWLARVSEGRLPPLPKWPRLLTSLLIPAPAGGVMWFAWYKTNAHQTLWQAAKPIAGLAVGCLVAGFIFHLILERMTRPNDLAKKLIVWWIAAQAMMHGILFNMDKLESSLGHNSSWKILTQSVAHLDLVGVPIQEGLHPTGEKPEFTRPGPRVLMYEFYFRGCSFYVMRDKSEVVPVYAGDPLWELERDRNADRKPIRDDLVPLLKGPETVYVFTRPQHRKELQELTGMDLPVVARTEGGRHEIVLFRNRDDPSHP